MQFEITLSEKKARKIVDAIFDGGFFIAGSGHFNISREEAAQLMIYAFERNAVNKIDSYYSRLSLSKGM